MNRYALTFTVKPGSEQDTARILSSYARPAAGGTPGGPPLLRRTTVALSGNRVVRVMEVHGDLSRLLAHLSRQPQLRAVEEALDPYLERPRDLSHPDGMRDFLERSRLEQVQDRVTPPDLLPAYGQATEERVVLCLPVRPGGGSDVARLLARVRDLTPDVPTTVARTTIFANRDVAVWVVDVAGDPDEALDGLAAAAVRSGAVPELTRFVGVAQDITTRPRFREFLADCTARALSDRRVGVPDMTAPSVMR
jgi:hypothetical protein